MKTLIKTLIGEGEYSDYVISRKLPLKLDNALYTLIHFIGGMTTREVTEFANQAKQSDLEELYELIIKFPNTIQAIMPMAGSYKALRNSEQYQKIIDIIKMEDMEEEMITEHDHNDFDGVNVGTDGFISTDTNPYFTNYISPKVKQKLFKHWDSLGEADYDSLKLFGVVETSSLGADAGGFHNVGDVLYPVLAIEWVGGVENTEFAKAPWQETSEMGFERLKFKVEPIHFDYMFDESASFGESGYACWDIRVLIDKDGDLELPVNPEYIDNYGDYTPFVQDLFPESARNKLSPFRNYTEDQFELIENLWDQYDRYRHLSSQFCRVEVVLVDKKEL